MYSSMSVVNKCWTQQQPGYKSSAMLLAVRTCPYLSSTLRVLTQFIAGKIFHYFTEPPLPDVTSLKGTPLLASRSFYLCASSEQLVPQMESLDYLRASQKYDEKPLIVWEPVSAECTPERLDNHVLACEYVDVFAPNHVDLTALFSDTVRGEKKFEPAFIESYARRIMEEFDEVVAGRLKMVVRTGEHGCMTLDGKGECRWLPPYYTTDDEAVVDTTGAGSAFLGAFTLMLRTTNDVVEAAIFGSVAASFVLDQIGIPKRESQSEQETWNGSSFEERLTKYRERLEQSSQT
jgi:hypothetical protein